MASKTVATPMAKETASCLEAARAAALVAHSAAGLCASARHRCAARLLRSCEATARAAVASLLGTAAKATTSRSSTPAPVGTTGKEAAAAPDAVGAASSTASRRRARRRNKKKKVQDELMGTDDVPREVVAAAGGGLPVATPPRISALLPTAAVFEPSLTRLLVKRIFRDRSPYRREPSPPSTPHALVVPLTAAADVDGFARRPDPLAEGVGLAA